MKEFHIPLTAFNISDEIYLPELNFDHSTQLHFIITMFTALLPIFSISFITLPIGFLLTAFFSTFHYYINDLVLTWIIHEKVNHDKINIKYKFCKVINNLL